MALEDIHLIVDFDQDNLFNNWRDLKNANFILVLSSNVQIIWPKQIYVIITKKKTFPQSVLIMNIHILFLCI